MTCDSASRSLFESPLWKTVARLAQERLRVRFGAPQGIEPDALLVQADFTPYQAVTPVWVDSKRVAQERHGTVLRRAANEDDTTLQGRLQVQTPTRGKWRPGRDRPVMPGGTLSARRHIPCRARTQADERLMIEAPPDFLLPAPIEVLDAVLESGFARGREDRHDAQAKTQPDDAAHRVGVLMRSLKSIIVVELRVAGHSDVAPVRDQRRDDVAGRERPARPRADEAAMQRRAGQDLDLRAIGQA